MEECVGTIMNTIIDKISIEVKKKKTKERIMNHVIEPLLKDIITKYYSYLITMISMLIIIILLLICIFVLVILQRYNYS